MTYFLVAGEKSGDMHAANLMKSLSELDKEAVFKGYGGDNMIMAGLDLVHHYREISFMGVWEVIKNLRTIKAKLTECKQVIMEMRPDVLILVDFPGFNLRLAKFAKSIGLNVAYYIAPKTWAWKEKRVFKIKKYVDKVYSILPFEKQYFEQFGLDVEYVGSPTLEHIKQHRNKPLDTHDRAEVVACLPGSRVQEVQSSLDLIGEVASLNPEVIFYVAAVDNLESSIYNRKWQHNVKVLTERTYDILQRADAAIVVSGTATLETALFDVPQVVCYRTSTLTYHLAKWVLKIKYLSLVNLILDQPLVRELVQDDFNPKSVNAELQKLLQDPRYTSAIRVGYNALIKEMGDQVASERTAHLICKDFG